VSDGSGMGPPEAPAMGCEMLGGPIIADSATPAPAQGSTT